jgi:hypothetical protein
MTSNKGSEVEIWRLAITMWQIVKRKTKDYVHGMIN